MICNHFAKMLKQFCYFHISSLQLVFGAKDLAKTNFDMPLISFYVLKAFCSHYLDFWSHVHSKSSHYVGFQACQLGVSLFAHYMMRHPCCFISFVQIPSPYILSSLEIVWNKLAMHLCPSFSAMLHNVEINLNWKNIRFAKGKGVWKEKRKLRKCKKCQLNCNNKKYCDKKLIQTIIQT